MFVVQEGQKWKGCGFCPFFVRVEVMQTVAMTVGVVVRTAMNREKCERERAYSGYVYIWASPPLLYCAVLSPLSALISPALPFSPLLSILMGYQHVLASPIVEAN